MVITNKGSNPQQPTLLLDAGHTEYGLNGDTEGVTVQYLSVDEESTPEQLVEFEAAFRLLVQSDNNWLRSDEFDGVDTWTTLVRVQGKFPALINIFKQLALQLMPSLDPAGYTPGGDDDYYDYYPSGMRLLREMAMDLQQLAEEGDVYDFVEHYLKPGPVSVYFAVVADYLRREALRWEPNWITCANVGYDDFFRSEEVDTYVAQACEHLGFSNDPKGWNELASRFGLSPNCFVRWADPREGDHTSPGWEPTYTSEQPYKEETNA